MSRMDELARRWWNGELGAAGNALDVALAPAEAAYRLGTGLRNRAYDRGVLQLERADLPVISVGNIAVGGTGKTPFTSWLAQQLVARGERPAIVHGGYALDEPELHREWTPHIPVLVDRNRTRAARDARAAGATVVVLDDAFQHRRLHRDLDVVLLSVERWAEAVRLLPRGAWRETPAALARADLIVCMRRTPVIRESARLAAAVAERSGRTVVRAALDASAWRRGGAVAAAPEGQCLLVAGIADPALFGMNVHAAGAHVSSTLTFPDHHDYSEGDAARIIDAAAGRPIVTSAKDRVKLRHHIDDALLWVLTQNVVIEDGGAHIDDALDRVLR